MQENVLVLAWQRNPFKVFIIADKTEQFHICVFFLFFPLHHHLLYSA